MLSITIPIAFLGGIFSFFSPCVLPLVIPYISYISGVSISYIREGNLTVSDRFKVLISSVFFVIGFSIVFITFGVLGGQLGGILTSGRDVIMKIAGVLVAIFGLHMTGIIRIPFFDYVKKIDTEKISGKSYLSSFLIGLAFAFSWTPCIGLILGGIITIAFYQGQAIYGGILTFFYSLGMALPFLVISFLSTYFVDISKKFGKFMFYSQLAGGLILVLTGILIFFNQLQVISNFLIEIFPFLSTLG